MVSAHIAFVCVGAYVGNVMMRLAWVISCPLDMQNGEYQTLVKAWFQKFQTTQTLFKMTAANSRRVLAGT